LPEVFFGCRCCGQKKREVSKHSMAAIVGWGGLPSAGKDTITVLLRVISATSLSP